jgi:hypothetical protein
MLPGIYRTRDEKHLAHIYECGYREEWGTVWLGTLSRVDASEYAVPNVWFESGMDTDGIRALDLNMDTYEPSNLARELATLRAQVEVLWRELRAAKGQVYPHTRDMQGPCRAFYYGEQQDFSTLQEGVAWIDAKLTQDFGPDSDIVVSVREGVSNVDHARDTPQRQAAD